MTHRMIVGIFAAVSMGCTVKSSSNAADTRASAAKPDSTAAMSSMAGMSGTMMTKDATDSMHAEMTRLTAATPDQAKGMVAMHRQMVANMLSQMNADMRSMNMTADPAWTALVDSIRRDLVNLPDLSGTQLTTMLPDHRTRVERLMSMHEKMMGPMKR